MRVQHLGFSLSLFAGILGCTLTPVIGCGADGQTSSGSQAAPTSGSAGTTAAAHASPQAGSTAIATQAGASTPPRVTNSVMGGAAAAPRAGASSPPMAAGANASAGAGGAMLTVGTSAGAGRAGSIAGGSSGAGGAAGATDSGLPPGATNFTSICAGGKLGMDSDAAGKLPALDGGPQEYAGVKYLAKSPNQVVGLKTTLVVPKTPTVQNVLFIWPGVQNRGGADPGRIGNGILQPVMTWGPSCAPKLPPNPYQTGWWISGQYVNVSTSAAGPTGCAGGDYLTTSLGDYLEIDMSLKDGKWVQTIKDVQTQKTVDYSIDLKGQIQNDSMWLIEVPNGERARPAEDTVWLQNVLTFAQPVTTCQPDRKGAPDKFSAPTLSPDGLHCCIDTIVLPAQR